LRVLGKLKIGLGKTLSSDKETVIPFKYIIIDTDKVVINFGSQEIHNSIFIEWRGTEAYPDSEGQNWAVVYKGQRLSRRGQLDYEPSPSNRSIKFIKNHSFTLKEAKEAAHKLFNSPQKLK